MPIYEYECLSCGIVEVTQKITENALEKCPKCEASEGFHRIISGTSFQLKGAGWYKTDYSSSSKKSEDKSKSENSEKKDPKPPCGSGCGCH